MWNNIRDTWSFLIGHERVPVDDATDSQTTQEFATINLAHAPGEKTAWGKPAVVVYLWALTELLLVTNPLQISSKLRINVLRLFGAEIGDQVIFRPRTRVKFPWKLKVGDRTWIGEGVWIHNQDQVTVGVDAVISQETFITTGSHAHRSDMGLITKPIIIRDGAWITSRCIITGGADIGRNSLVQPMSRVSGVVPENMIVGSPGVTNLEPRFKRSDLT